MLTLIIEPRDSLKLMLPWLWHVAVCQFCNISNRPFLNTIVLNIMNLHLCLHGFSFSFVFTLFFAFFFSLFILFFCFFFCFWIWTNCSVTYHIICNFEMTSRFSNGLICSDFGLIYVQHMAYVMWSSKISRKSEILILRYSQTKEVFPFVSFCCLAFTM